MDGDDIGRSADIMLDVRSGRIAYAVVSAGNPPGSGDKLLAVPGTCSCSTSSAAASCCPSPPSACAKPRLRQEPLARDGRSGVGRGAAAYYGSSPYWLIEEGETALDSPPYEASPGGPEAPESPDGGKR